MKDTSEYLLEPAGPRWPTLAQTLVWGARPTWFSEYCARRYGDVFSTRLPGSRMVHFSHPDAIKAIFELSADDYSGFEAAELVLEPFVGRDSVLLLDGEPHRDERRALSRGFHGDAMSRHEAVITEATRREVSQWPFDESFAVHPRMQAITLEVILRIIFGVDDAARLSTLLPTLREYLARGGSYWVLAPPLRRNVGGRSPWARFVRLRDDIHQALDHHIEQRRADPGVDGRSDMLSLLLRHSGDAVSRDHLRTELMTMLLAGHDTTATALAWAVDLLAHHPEVQTRLVESIGEGDDRYLDAVVRETLRLRPVIPEVSRQLTRPATIATTRVAAGTTVVANIHLAHRRSDVWSDPLAFRPERFLGPAPDVHGWIPFGGGVRRCIGAAFATLETRTVLRTVLREVTVRPARPRPEPFRRRVVTLVPRHGAPVLVSARPAPTPAGGGSRPDS